MRGIPAGRRPLAAALTATAFLICGSAALAQLGNGKLQIHHIDVGQGDAALIVSPLGQLALVDDGTYTNCAAFVNYLTGLGITDIDYNFASHYHADHIGCLDDLMGAGVDLNVAGYDRGDSYDSATYTSYVNALGGLRETMAVNQTVTLDAGSPNPVVIKCVALNGAGVYPADGSDENALSVVLRVTYGAFDEVMGGDLTGDTSNNVEGVVGPMVGDVEVYKVHHHGSATSTTDPWLTAVTAEVGVISVGSNSYGHPTAEALDRLHAHGVKTYWTQIGDGANPDPAWDQVGGTIVVQADPAEGAAYTVTGDGFVDTYTNSGGQTLAKTYYPTGVTMLAGTVGAGSYANLAADDGSYLQVNSVKIVKKYYTDWYGSTVVQEDPTKLTLTYNGRYSASGTQTLSLYNFATAAWTQVDAATVGTSDVTRTCIVADPADFVSTAGEIRARVARAASNKAFFCYGDYLAFAIEYADTKALAALDGPDQPGDDSAPARSGSPLLAESLKVWPNPTNPSVRISFELDRSIQGRVCVYDLAGRQVAELADGRLERGLQVLLWNGADASGRALSSGVYLARIEGEGVSRTLKFTMIR